MPTTEELRQNLQQTRDKINELQSTLQPPTDETKPAGPVLNQSTIETLLRHTNTYRELLQDRLDQIRRDKLPITGYPICPGANEHQFLPEPSRYNPVSIPHETARPSHHASTFYPPFNKHFSSDGPRHYRPPQTSYQPRRERKPNPDRDFVRKNNTQMKR